MLLVLQGCAGLHIYNSKYYDLDSEFFYSLPDLSNNFKICHGLFTKQQNVVYEAGLVCSTIDKKAQFIERRFFKECYFLFPITSIFKCIEN